MIELLLLIFKFDLYNTFIFATRVHRLILKSIVIDADIRVLLLHAQVVILLNLIFLSLIYFFLHPLNHELILLYQMLLVVNDLIYLNNVTVSCLALTCLSGVSLTVPRVFPSANTFHIFVNLGCLDQVFLLFNLIMLSNFG